MGNHGNPATRLREIMEEALNEGDGTNAYTKWAKVLRTEGDEAKFFRRIARLTELVRGVRRDVLAASPRSAELVLTYYGEVEGVVSNFPSVGQIQMLSMVQGLKRETGIYGLRHAELILDEALHIWTISDDKLEELREKINDVRAAMSDESEPLTGSDADWLRDLLNDLEEALDVTFIDGPDEVARVADRMVGGLARRPAFMERLRDSPTGKNVGLLVGAVLAVLAVASGIKDLTTGDGPPDPPHNVQVLINQLNVPAIGQLDGPVVIEQRQEPMGDDGSH